MENPWPLVCAHQWLLVCSYQVLLGWTSWLLVVSQQWSVVDVLSGKYPVKTELIEHKTELMERSGG